MTVHAVLIDVLLSVVVAACWMGVLGMLRMRHPLQSLQFLGLPATIGMLALTVAVFAESGASAAGFKTLLIAAVLLAINSVITHATARAFRTRELGHWEPRDGDPIEWVGSTHHPPGPGSESRP